MYELYIFIEVCCVQERQLICLIRAIQEFLLQPSLHRCLPLSTPEYAARMVFMFLGCQQHRPGKENRMYYVYGLQRRKGPSSQLPRHDWFQLQGPETAGRHLIIAGEESSARALVCTWVNLTACSRQTRTHVGLQLVSVAPKSSHVEPPQPVTKCDLGRGLYLCQWILISDHEYRLQGWQWLQ